MITKENVKKSNLILSLSKIKTSQILWVLAFSVLTFIGAQIAIPTQPVPFTLQTMVVILAGAFLGSREGFMSQVVYLFAGIVGIPVFAGFLFGPLVLFGPTGGYLLSFPFAAMLVGFIVEKNKSNFAVLSAMVLGSLLILLFGASYLAIFMGGDFMNALFSGAIIFSVWDILKITAAFGLYKLLSSKR